MIDELVHCARLAEAHLDLGRMHIDVDPGRIQFEKQHVGGMAAAVQDVCVGLADRVGQQFVTDVAAVHEEVLGVPARA